MKINHPEKFTDIVTTNYLSQGLVSMSKRDLDLLLLYALCEDGRYSFPDDFHRACRELKLGESKLRGMLKDMHLRYKTMDEETAINEFASIVERQEFEVDASRILFVIRDPILRIYIEEWIAKASCFSDTSFNPDVVKITRRGFVKLIDYAFQNSEKEIELPEELQKKSASNDDKTYGKIFLDAFCESAGQTAGSVSVQTIASGIRFVLQSLVAS